MKKIILIMTIAGLMLSFTACNKDENGPAVSNLEASKSAKIKKGEPVSFKLAGAPEGSAVLWNVTPDKDVKITAAGNIASVFFANAGSYTVNATYGTLKATSTVSVQDSIYNPGTGGTSTVVSLTGDQIAIAVTKMPDSMGLVGLNLSFVTKNKYKCMNNTLLFTQAVESSNSIKTYKIEFTGVEIPGDNFCASGESYSSGVTGFYPIADGESKLVIILNGITYQGTINKTSTAITIAWPYSSIVTITPLTITI